MVAPSVEVTTGIGVEATARQQAGPTLKTLGLGGIKLKAEDCAQRVRVEYHSKTAQSRVSRKMLRNRFVIDITLLGSAWDQPSEFVVIS
jgi:hypothetical protein